MGLGNLDISNAYDGVDVAAGNAFNDSSPVPIKDIRANTSGVINVITEYGTSMSFDALKGERLNLKGKVEVLATTTADINVYLEVP